MSKKKSSNKGFTLVELIIVVAIIAILASVLVPQYLSYVERSRESNDLQVASNIMDAATLAIADPANEVPSNYNLVFRWDTAGDSKTGEFFLDTASSTPTVSSDAVWVDKLTMAMGSIIGNNPSNNRIPVGTKALSAAANASDLAFSINTATGQVRVLDESASWVDTIGINANTATSSTTASSE